MSSSVHLQRTRAGALVVLAVALVAAGVAVPGAAAPARADSKVSATIPISLAASPRGVAVDAEHGVVYVANGAANTVSVIDTATNTVSKTIPFDARSGIGTKPMGVAVDPSSDHAYVTNAGSSTVSVIDTVTQSVTAVIPTDPTAGIGLAPASVAVDPDRHVAYVVNSSSNSVSVIDTTTNSVTAVVPTGPYPSDVAFDLSLGRAYVANIDNSSLTVIDVNTHSPLSPIGVDSPATADFSPVAVAVDSTRHRIYVGGDEGSEVVVIDGLTATAATTIAGIGTGAGTSTGTVQALAVDPGSHLLVVASAGGGGITIVDTLTDRVVRNLPTAPAGGSGPGAGWDVAIDGAASKVYSSNFQLGSVSVVDLDEGGPAGVTRVGGADRFEVSAAASAAVFPRGTRVAYVASGSNFPDALSGSAAAGGRGPVLLVRPDALPDVIARELARLRPDRIIVLGGTAAVSAEVQAQLDPYAPTVERIAGSDRFEVSAAVSRATFPARPTVAYVASGENFPDALSGSAAAGAQHGPVLLVQKNAVPAAVRTELARLVPASIVVLGGAAAVSDDVVTTLQATAPTTRIAGADRFVVSSAVSASAFVANSTTAYVASGENFPDALSGAAAAIPVGAPMLLVRSGALPGDIAAELDRLNPKRIVVLGGASAVNDSVLEELKAHLRK